jgi:hypothetical protein
VVPVVAAVVLVAAVVYALMPFTFAGVVRCSAPLTGSSADPSTPAGAVVGNPDEACAGSAGRRLVNAGAVAAAAVVLGVGGAFLPSERQVEDRGGGDRPPSGEGTGSRRP